jgi:hypothetical protein
MAIKKEPFLRVSEAGGFDRQSEVVSKNAALELRR